MKNNFLTLCITLICFSQNLLGADGVTIKLSEDKLNEFIELASLSQLLSYTLLDKGTTEVIADCDNLEIEIKKQVFFHASIANTVSLDLKNNNRFSLSSTDKYTDSNGVAHDVFLRGGGTIKAPSIPLVREHTVELRITTYGTINGSFKYENNKLILDLDDIDLKVFGEADDGTACGSEWILPIGFLESPYEWETDINIGTSILPNALTSYFKQGTPTITTTTNELSLTFETIPFKETELNESYSAEAAYEIELGEITVPSSAQNSNIIAGSTIKLKDGFQVKSGAVFKASIVPYDF
ncbi:3-coathanger stack domain-containing protein [Reichenbachiella sp.]|uniref:3-coathanger stack domain-containing protein n=1 Tax=Reichenbachiella sp. TaxID=2184521 RepID=UPI003BAF5B8C